MSRPPRPYSGQSTTGAPKTGRGPMDYMPSEFGNLVDRQRALAATELGLVSSGQEGDFAGTLMELSALVAHVLAVYQDRFAGESFLGTARSARSLVRHGRRLGYEPDPGLAATGYLLLHVQDGLSGTVPRGFAVASAPVGEKKAQDYETLQDVTVDHRHNELWVHDRMEPYTLYDPRTFEVRGTRLGLTVGDVIVISTSSEELSAHVVQEVSEAEARGTTTLVVEPPLAFTTVGAGYRLHAKPAVNTHLFGWDAPSLTYSDEELRAGAFSAGEDGAGHGYVVDPYSDHDLYLAAEVEKLQAGTPVVRVMGGEASAYRLDAHASRAVVFRKTVAVPVTTYVRGKEGQVTLDTTYVPQTNELASTVTAVLVSDPNQGALSRKEQSIRASRWLLGFQLSVELVNERPSGVDVTQPVRLVGQIDGLAPGQLIALSHIEDVDEVFFDVEIAEITSVGVTGRPLHTDFKRGQVVIGDIGVSSTIGFRVIEPATGGRDWKLGQLRIRGNVARLSHGKTMEEVLGDSDGVTPFLRFPLKHAPLTHLPSPDGAAPELEVRVGGVLWTRVADFYESDPYDRHYLLQRDEAGTTSVVFGDGRQGAIPPAGKKHLHARYRMGLGRTGNADPGQVDRVKKAHPLVKRAYNPTRLSGGTEPAGAEDVRTQATRFIRTFGRAVSVQDHADLALLFPGVARAVAHQTKVGTDPETGEGGRLGIRVTVSDAAGDEPGGMADLQKFLDARRDPVVPLEVVGPAVRDIELKVYLEIDRAFLTETVQAAVREVLYGERSGAPGLFTFPGRALGQPAYLSEVYAALTAVPGVSFVQVTLFDLEAREWEAKVADVILAQPGEWLRLRPERFGFSLPTEEAP